LLFHVQLSLVPPHYRCFENRFDLLADQQAIAQAQLPTLSNFPN